MRPLLEVAHELRLLIGRELGRAVVENERGAAHQIAECEVAVAANVDRLLRVLELVGPLRIARVTGDEVRDREILGARVGGIGIGETPLGVLLECLPFASLPLALAQVGEALGAQEEISRGAPLLSLGR